MSDLHKTPKKFKYGRLIDVEQQKEDSRKRNNRLKKERDEFHEMFLGLGGKEKRSLK